MSRWLQANYTSVDKALKYTDNAFFALLYKKITKEDGDLFYKVLNKAIEDSDNAYYLLKNNIITREDGDLFYDVIRRSNRYFLLLKDKTITREDGEFFNEALNKAIDSRDTIQWLFEAGVITKEEYNKFMETYKKGSNNV